MTSHNHPYHLVEKSPWPITASIGALAITMGSINMLHSNNYFLVMSGVIIIIMTMIQWWRDITRESTYQGLHTNKVLIGLKWGMVLFIISEVFFFISFFWAFFHSSLSPTLETGSMWPPYMIMVFNPFQIPLLNTAILLSSGITVTWTHHSMMNANHSNTMIALSTTVLLGMYFTLLQIYEYSESSFTIADSIYGSTFFMATGFHGFHVLIGTTFLSVCLLRMNYNHFSSHHHFGFEAAAWYWHFVDVVWLFLYISIYWWGG